ncbi:MAG TPA: hypothetical protein VJ455_05930 [Ignavibacteria bacterium]|nr:hypothetical protein [Ignavibacteria bacterium]
MQLNVSPPELNFVLTWQDILFLLFTSAKSQVILPASVPSSALASKSPGSVAVMFQPIVLRSMPKFLPE